MSPIVPKLAALVLAAGISNTAMAARPIDVVFTPELAWSRIGDAPSFMTPTQENVVVARMPSGWLAEHQRDCKKHGELKKLADDTWLCELTFQNFQGQVHMWSLGRRIRGSRDAVSVVAMKLGGTAKERRLFREFMSTRARHCLRFVKAAPEETEGDVFVGESVERCDPSNVTDAESAASSTLDASALTGLSDEERAFAVWQQGLGRFTPRAQAWEAHLGDRRAKVRVSSDYFDPGTKSWDGTSNYSMGSKTLIFDLCAHKGGLFRVEEFQSVAGYVSTSTTDPVQIEWFVGDDGRAVTLYVFMNGGWGTIGLGSDRPGPSVEFDKNLTMLLGTSACR